MNESIIRSIFSNDNTFSFESKNSLFDTIYPDNPYINSEEYSIISLSICSSLIKANRNSSHESSPKKVEFNVKRKDIGKKRGRHPKNKDKTSFHDKTRDDNLMRKIQIHFLTFVIDYCNDALRDEYNYSKDFFRHINHESKKTVNYNYTSKLKNSTIKDLLKMDISDKYSRYEKTYNKDLLEEIENSSPFLSELFEMSFLELFNKYYNEGNPLDKIVYKNKIINLSDETKSFSNLIDKNKDIEKYLIDIAERVYIC